MSKFNLNINIRLWMIFLCLFFGEETLSQSVPKELITTKQDSWRSATIFTHVIWKDLLFYGGGAGADGGDPRHEIEIGVFHLVKPDSGFHHKNNPVITRKQFGLDQPGKGITPLSIFDRGDSLFMFCTSRPNDDLQPRIVLISALVDDPFRWGNYKIVIDQSFSGKENNHGASVLMDPENDKNILLYFAARSINDEYRILLATAAVNQISNPVFYQLLNDYDNAVLKRGNSKTNYPYVRYIPEQRKYELWYSGQSLDNLVTRSCFKTVSDHKDCFEPAQESILDPSGVKERNDNAYATGPKVYEDNLYYSGRKKARGNYLSIFYHNLKN